MKHSLKVTETKNKAGRFLYQVVNESGVVVAERRSNRDYVACLVDARSFFGRVDLAQAWVTKHIKLAHEWQKKPAYLEK
jgi:hypothetical protein